MNKKIELIQTNNGWSWFILKIEAGGGWYTAATGFEITYEEAAAAAKQEYEKAAA